MRRTLVAGALVLALTACGQTDGSISREASAVLAPEVSAIRSAAVAQNRSEAARRLTSLRQSVADLTQEGRLSQEAARRILDAAAEVENNLNLIPVRQAPSPLRTQAPRTQRPSPPPPTLEAPTTPPTFAPSPKEQPKEEKDEKGDDGDNGGQGKDGGSGGNEQTGGNQSGSQSSGPAQEDAVAIVAPGEE